MMNRNKLGLLAVMMLLSAYAAAGIDINTATAEQLAQGLNGIGLVKAEEIVRYRLTNGPFTSVDQLDAVQGIGAGLIERNRDRLVVSDTMPAKK